MGLTKRDIELWIFYEDLTAKLNRPPTEQELCAVSRAPYMSVASCIDRIRNLGQEMPIHQEFPTKNLKQERAHLAEGSRYDLQKGIQSGAISGKHIPSQAYPDAYTFMQMNLGKSIPEQ